MSALSAVPQPQQSLYETTIEDAELEQLLDDRAKAKDAASKANKRARRLDEAARAKLETLDLADAPVRIGNYLVAYRPVAARQVNFTAEATSRLVIKPLPEQ